MELNSFQLSSCSLCVQMKKILSTYLNHTKGCNSSVSKKKSLNFIHKQTGIGWGKLGTNSGTRNVLLNLSVKLEVVILQNKICHPYQFTSRNIVLFSLIKYFLRAFNPGSCGMLGYKSTTSAMTKIVFSGIEPKFHVFFIKSPESLMYNHPFCIKGFK